VDAMGGECSTRGKAEKRIQNFCRKKLSEETTLVDVGTDGRRIVKWILKK